VVELLSDSEEQPVSRTVTANRSGNNLMGQGY